MNKLLILLTIFAHYDLALGQQSPALGQPLDTASAAAAASVIWPDGSNLPAGAGTVEAGKALYGQKCQVCHGLDGRGGVGGELAGGNFDLSAEQPDQNIGTYWPYATTLFDFIRRAMPLTEPWSLTADEVYALCAYLLHLNGLVAADLRMDAETLRQVQMPNRHGFVGIDAEWPVQTP